MTLTFNALLCFELCACREPLHVSQLICCAVGLVIAACLAQYKHAVGVRFSRAEGQAGMHASSHMQVLLTLLVHLNTQ